MTPAPIPAMVLGDLAEFTHFVTRVKIVPAVADDVSLTEAERNRGRAFATKLSMRVLARTWQMLLKGITEVEAAGRPVDAAEMVLVRIAYAADLPTPDEADPLARRRLARQWRARKDFDECASARADGVRRAIAACVARRRSLRLAPRRFAARRADRARTTRRRHAR